MALLRAGTAAAHALTSAAGGCATTPCPGSADTGYANYAFASELGSGVYEINGSTIQVYQLVPSYRLRSAQEPRGRPGIQLIFPVTVGFFNFQLQDLAHLQIPTHIGAVSLEPGVELDYWLGMQNWHLYPYIKGGATFASSADVNAYIWALGVRTDRATSVSLRARTCGVFRAGSRRACITTAVSTTARRSRTTPLYAAAQRGGVQAQLSVPRTASGALSSASTGWATSTSMRPYGPESGISARTLQFEGGLMFGARPQVPGVGRASGRGLASATARAGTLRAGAWCSASPSEDGRPFPARARQPLLAPAAR